MRHLATALPAPQHCLQLHNVKIDHKKGYILFFLQMEEVKRQSELSTVGNNNSLHRS
jgi:hypothetical protein